MMPSNDVDRQVALALASALGERKMRMTDRRLLILYLINIAVVLAVAIVLLRADAKQNADRAVFQEAVVINCNANKENTQNFNDFIDKLNQATNKSRLLTAKEKKQREAFFVQGKGEVPTCPPR